MALVVHDGAQPERIRLGIPSEECVNQYFQKYTSYKSYKAYCNSEEEEVKIPSKDVDWYYEKVKELYQNWNNLQQVDNAKKLVSSSDGPSYKNNMFKTYCEEEKIDHFFYKDGRFTLTTKTNFFELGNALGSNNKGWESKVGCNSHGWFRSGACFLLFLQCFLVTGKHVFNVTKVSKTLQPSVSKPQKRKVSEQTRKGFGIIYYFFCTITKMYYIGQTKRTFEKRKNEHYKQSSGCRKIKHALMKYGPDSFEKGILTTCLVEDLDKYETYYIRSYNSVTPNGYNISAGNFSFDETGEEDFEPSQDITNTLSPIERNLFLAQITSDIFNFEDSVHRKLEKISKLANDETNVHESSHAQSILDRLVGNDV